MKNSLLTLSTLALTVSVGAGLGYADHFRKTILLAKAPVVAAVTPSPLAAPAPEPLAPTPTVTPNVEQLFAEAGTVVENSTQKNHAGLTDVGDRVSAGIKKQVDDWKSQGFTASLESDEELSRSLLDFTQKLSALNLADEITWVSVQNDTIASLRHLQGVYADLSQESAKK